MNKVFPTLIAGLSHGMGTTQDTYVLTLIDVLQQTRQVTPIECERLQGFPEGWTDSQSDTQRYKQLGNAITVNVAQWIGTQLKQKETNV